MFLQMDHRELKPERISCFHFSLFSDYLGFVFDENRCLSVLYFHSPVFTGSTSSMFISSHFFFFFFFFLIILLSFFAPALEVFPVHREMSLEESGLLWVHMLSSLSLDCSSFLFSFD